MRQEGGAAHGGAVGVVDWVVMLWLWRMSAAVVQQRWRWWVGSTAREREQERQGERVGMGERSSYASLYSFCWLDRPGRHRRATATRRVRPSSDRPRCARSADSNRPSGQLTFQLRTTVTPNSCRISKNYISESCRAM